MSRLAILVDGGYLENICKNEFHGQRIDFSKFPDCIRQKVEARSELLRTYYYDCDPYQSNPPTQAESDRLSKKQGFFRALGRLPSFEVRKGTLQRLRSGENEKPQFRQKMVDVLLSIDLVRLSLKQQITHVAIISGDADYVPAIKVAKDEGVSVWVFHGKQHIHHELSTVADQVVPLSGDYISFQP